MRNLIRAAPRRFAAGVFATALVLAGVQRADAQSVFFSGFTAGCFGAGCTPTTGGSSIGGLSYNSGTFSGTATSGTAITQTFGSFTLIATGSAVVYNSSFTLLLTFIDPLASQNTFVAAVSGAIDVNQGGVSIDFDNTPQTWSDANGTYSVRLNDVQFLAGGPTTNALTGELASPTTVPEPISLVLLATGLAGLGAVRRLRKSVTKADLS